MGYSIPNQEARASMFTWYRILRNAIDFPIRRAIRWKRGRPTKAPLDKGSAYAHLNGDVLRTTQERALALIEEYGLASFASACTLKQYTTNLFYLEMLVTTFKRADFTFDGEAAIKTMDVGPGAWTYASALHSFLSRWGCENRRPVDLQGMEIDAFRVFNDLHSRFDHAEKNLDGLDGVRFSAEPFTPAPDHFDLVTLFYPFVLLPDHLEWGLPRKLFQPGELLENSWRSLKPGGVLFVANQGPDEFEEQKALFTAAGIPDGPSFHFESELHHYEIPRYAHFRQREV